MNLNPFIAQALNSHQCTLEQYGIQLGAYDRRTIREEIASLKDPKETEARTWLVINYYITALVKFIKSKQGQGLDLKVEVYPDFVHLYHKAIERPWNKGNETLRDKAIKLIKKAITIPRNELSKKLGISSSELQDLLSNNKEINQAGAVYYV